MGMLSDYESRRTAKKVAIIAGIAIVVIVGVVLLLTKVIFKDTEENPPEPTGTVVENTTPTEAPTITDTAPTDTVEPPRDIIEGRPVAGSEVISALEHMEAGKAYAVGNQEFMGRTPTSDEYKYKRFLITPDGTIMTDADGNNVSFYNFGAVTKSSTFIYSDKGVYIDENGFETEDETMMVYTVDSEGELSKEQVPYVIKKSYIPWDGNNKTVNISPTELYREITILSPQREPVGYVYIPDTIYSDIKESEPSVDIPEELQAPVQE